jgi:hypothetical protein
VFRAGGWLFVLSYILYIILLLYIIHYYILYIIYYTYTIIILYIITYYIIHILLLYTILLSPSSHPILFLFSSSLLLFYHPIPSFPSHPLIHSILVGTYIYLFIFLSFLTQSFPPFPKYLTPHKLSEGCLEWCSFISIWFWFMF